MRRTNSRLLCVVLLTLLAILASGCSSGKSSPNPIQDGDPDTDGELDSDVQEGDAATEGDGETEHDADRTDEDADSDAEDGDVQEGEEEIPPAGTLATDPTRLDFGLLAFAEQKSLDFDILNTAAAGSSAITVTKIEWLLDYDSSFTLDSCPVPITLEAQAKKTCRVGFSPKHPGQLASTLRLVGRDAKNNPLELRLKATGDCVLPLSWVDLSRKNFGAVKLGQKALAYISLGNAGHAEWTINAVRLSEDSDPAFAVKALDETSSPLTLGFNEGRLYRVTFAPKLRGEVYAKLLIESDASQAPLYTVAFAGRGQEACPERRKDAADGDAENDAETESGSSDPATCALCIPGEARCTDENKGFEVCNAAGAAWEAATACGSGMTCRAGVCQFAICEEGASLCEAGQPLRCDKADTPLLSSSCISSSACQETACRAGKGCEVQPQGARCDDDNPCTTDTCQEDGSCAYTFNTDSCDNADACTTQSKCQLGHCVGQARLCDDHNPCTSDSCDKITGCVFTPHDGGSCSDSDICTIGDHCESGRCVGAMLPCDDGNPCTTDSCDPALGCVYASSSADCDDGNPCTNHDTCSSGRCQGQPIYTNDGLFCNGREICTPQTGILHIDAPICDDGIACTHDACNNTALGCTFTPDNALCDDNNPCTNDLCDAKLGCLHTPVADNTPCDVLPGLAEACFDGQCVGGCTADLDCQDAFACTFDSCDKATGHCRHEPIDALCDDGVFCNGAELCHPTLGCVAGTPIDCTDAFACTLDRCDESKRACVHAPTDSLCDDKNACTTDRCDPTQGGCVYATLDTSCDDLDPCTVGDHCEQGRCKGGDALLSCDDGNPCTDDLCVPGQGCAHFNNARPCDDGIACTTMDTCQDGRCQGIALACDDGIFCNGVESCGENGCRPGTPPDCDDGVACTLDVCDENGKGCAHLPVDSLCEDDNPCTLDDRCTALGCDGTPAPDETACGQSALGPKICLGGFCAAPCKEDTDCDDGIVCTGDTCDTARGYCVHTPNDGLCDDGKFCNGAEVCHPTLGCRPGAKVNCDDKIACTLDACDEDSGACTHLPTDAFCNDGNPCTADLCGETGCTHLVNLGSCDDFDPCTEYDSCATGFCRGTPKACDDGNPCTLDFCQSGKGCATAPAPDGQACLLPDDSSGTCLLGACQAGCRSDSDCTSPVACAQPYCEQGSHTCKLLARDEWCDDGLLCNGRESCDVQFGCLPGQAIVCDDGIACTTDSCDSRDGSCHHTPDLAACDDHNPCTDDACSAEGCTHTFNVKPCDDQNACTENDTCRQGSCQGTARNCDDKNACTEDTCLPALGCIHKDTSADCPSGVGPCQQGQCLPTGGCRVIAKSGPCDDRNPNTIHDVCTAGTCLGTPVNCDDHNDCTNDSYSTASGSCVHALRPDGDTCKLSGLAQGRCKAGVCAVACQRDEDCEDRQSCTGEHCDPTTKTCIYEADDASCNDGLFCNGVESCQPFIGCVPGQAPECSDTVACTTDSCDEASKSCKHATNDKLCDDGNPCTAMRCDATLGCVGTPLSGTPCDDKNACTENDRCQAGSCTGSPVTCASSNPCLGAATCSPLFGCLATPLLDETPCGSAGEICLGGECAKACASNADCDDGLPCTRDRCDTALKRCRHYPDNSLCDDGLFCNGTESCVAGLGCVAGLPVNCDDQIACTLDACDNATKRCTHTPNPLACQTGLPCTTDRCDSTLGCVSTPQTNTACDDGNSCTQNDTCKNGVCTGGTALSCGPCLPDDNPLLCDPSGGCLSHSCDSRIGCISKALPNGTGCLTDFCDSTKVCLYGQCLSPFASSSCDDNNICTADSCDRLSGCLHTPLSSGACNDGNACTRNDSCKTGHCTGEPLDCNDHNPCTADSCDPANGCLHTPLEEGSACDENGRTCHAGICSTHCTADSECKDATLCSAGHCNTESGLCEYACTGTSNFCDGPLVCDPTKGCVAGPPPNCADAFACTADSCDRVHGACVHTPQNALCDDANACTIDVCQENSGCSHTPYAEGTPCTSANACAIDARCFWGACVDTALLSCDDHNPCTSDACLSGACQNTPQSGKACNDGSPLTQGDTCQNGACVGTPLSCDDGNPCTEDRLESSGQCTNHPLSGAICGNGGLCDPISVCLSGQCRAVQDVPCDDRNPCTTDTCNPLNGACTNTPNGACAR